MSKGLYIGASSLIELTGVKWASSTLQSAFRSVFVNTDPFQPSLQSTVPARALLYPVSYLLDRDQIEVVVCAARACGDDALCISLTEGMGDLTGDSAQHWQLSYWELTEYMQLSSVGVLENAVYSPSGRWGLLISHEQHALVGGVSGFVDELAAHWPGFDDSLPSFLHDWRMNQERHGADVAWIEPVLAQIYGRDRARLSMSAFASS